MLDQVSSGSLVLGVKVILALVIAPMGTALEFMTLSGANIDNGWFGLVECIDGGLPIPAQTFYLKVSQS